MGVLVVTADRAPEMPTSLSNLHRSPCVHPVPPEAAMRPEAASAIWFAHRKDTGFSDVMGSWKIMAMSLPRICLQLSRSDAPYQLLVSETGWSFPRRTSPGGPGDQAHYRERRDSLSAPRLTHYAQRFSLFYMEKETPSTALASPASVLKPGASDSLTSRRGDITGFPSVSAADPRRPSGRLRPG